MDPVISIIIPAYKAGSTIGTCLESIYRYEREDCEVVVVDDCSPDDSVRTIEAYPCRLIRLPRNQGAAAARNAGARASRGKYLFFIDADCVLTDRTPDAVRKNLQTAASGMVIGGTYTPVPHDAG